MEPNRISDIALEVGLDPEEAAVMSTEEFDRKVAARRALRDSQTIVLNVARRGRKSRAA